jgi:hypothetical protein
MWAHFYIFYEGAWRDIFANFQKSFICCRKAYLSKVFYKIQCGELVILFTLIFYYVYLFLPYIKLSVNAEKFDNPSSKHRILTWNKIMIHANKDSNTRLGSEIFLILASIIRIGAERSWLMPLVRIRSWNMIMLHGSNRDSNSRLGLKYDHGLCV